MDTLRLFYSTYTEIELGHSKCTLNPTIIKLNLLSVPIHFCQQRWLSTTVSSSLCSRQWGRRHGEIECNQAESAFPLGLFTHIICILGTLFPPPAPFPHKERPPRPAQAVLFLSGQCNPKGIKLTASLVQAEQDSARPESSLQNRSHVAPLTR